jgi:hypothetical protein
VADRTFLVLGGAGMVGFEVAREVAARFRPERVVVASLPRDEVERAVERLRRLTPPGVEVIGEWGDLFVRAEFAQRERRHLMEDDDGRRAIFDDLLGPLDAAYGRSQLALLLTRYRPDVVVDAINTATAISYQDVYSAAGFAERNAHALLTGGEVDPAAFARDVEMCSSSTGRCARRGPAST